MSKGGDTGAVAALFRFLLGTLVWGLVGALSLTGYALAYLGEGLLALAHYAAPMAGMSLVGTSERGPRSIRAPPAS